MTINNALRRFPRPNRGPKASRQREPIAIGEIDSHVFNCPRCLRPLATGAPICPGCGTRLIFGVRARLALEFIVVGMALGTILGGGLMYATRPTGSGTVAAIAPGASASVGPDDSSAPTPTPISAAAAGIPPKAVSALRQAAILDARLTASGAQLRAAIKSNAKAIDIARLLRTLNSDATFGVDLAPTIAPWTDAAKLANGLGSFYRAVRDSSQASLRSSVSNDKAYRAAGKRMLTLLGKLPALDASAAALVADHGLAPLTEPKPTASAAP